MAKMIKIAGYAPADTSHGRALDRLALEAERLSDGRIRTEVIHNILDLDRPVTDLLSMVETGELTVCFHSTSYLGSRLPELDILEVPFTFPTLEAAHSALDGPLGHRLTDVTETETGFAVLGYWDNGFRHFTNRLRPIGAPEDLAGMRVRLQPNRLHEAMIEAWGGVPVAVELSEGVAMIAAGSVDAQENPLANTAAYDVPRFHHYATMTGHLYGARGLYAHAATLGEMSPDDRDAIYEAARLAIVFQREDSAAGERALRTSLAAGGMEFLDLDSDERRAFHDAAEPAIALARATIDPELFDLVEQR